MNKVTAAATITDKNGRFSLEFDFPQSKTADLVIEAEKQYTRMFLNPDDSLYITADIQNFDESIKYIGKGSADNNYMAADQVQDFAIMAMRYFDYTDAEKYKIFVDSVESANNSFYDSYNKTGFSTEFLAYIVPTTKYRFIDTRWMFKVMYDRQ